MSAHVPTQPHNLPLHLTREICAGKTYIVTGANVGLGYEASKHLVSLGAKTVIMAVRNTAAGEKAKAEIEAATSTSGAAQVWALDLASYASVKQFAKRAVTELERIDALIENAGVATAERLRAEGHLLGVTVNVFSTFLLAVLLLPKMSEDGKKFGTLPHIVIVTSRAGEDVQEAWGKIKDDPFSKIDDENLGLDMAIYPLTKLLEILAVHHVAELLPVSRTGVVIPLVCPGFCKTELSRHASQVPEFKKRIEEMKQNFGRTAEDGSRTLLQGTVTGEGGHGQVHSSCVAADEVLPGWMRDKEEEKRVWDAIAEELEAIQPGCVKKILA